MAEETNRARRWHACSRPTPDTGSAPGGTACGTNFDTILSSFVDQYHLQISEGDLVFKKCRAYVLVLCCLASPVKAAGIQLLNSDPGLLGAIWYPCTAAQEDVPLGDLAASPEISLKGVKDCPVRGTKLPLIIFSHGRGGWFTMHHDTAEALADAGFVVAAINHPGDNGKDSSQRNSLSILVSRPADMVRLLDFMLNDWKARAAIDHARVGFFGFSRGGYTGLVLVGGNPDFRRIASHCTETSISQDCGQFRNGDIPPSPPHDARIRAAVVADPAETYPFTRDNLADIKIPLQVWRSELGGIVDASAIERVASSLPGKPDMHVVPAGHFAFLSPCLPQFAAAIPSLCTDTPAGFDRVAFHHEFDATIVRFFREHLMSDGGTR